MASTKAGETARRAKVALPPALDEPMTKDQVAAALKLTKRTLDGMIAAKEFPAPDFYLERSGRYRTTTINAWIT